MIFIFFSQAALDAAVLYLRSTRLEATARWYIYKDGCKECDEPKVYDADSRNRMKIDHRVNPQHSHPMLYHNSDHREYLLRSPVLENELSWENGRILLKFVESGLEGWGVAMWGGRWVTFTWAAGPGGVHK